MNRYMCLLLVLGTSAFLLARVEAQGNSGGGSNNNNNQGKSNQDRDDAINASKPGKPRKGAAGTLANGKLKSERFTECFNKMNKDMAGASRRKGDRPDKARGRKDTALNAASTCLDPTLNTCPADTPGQGNNPQGNTSDVTEGNPGRRLYSLAVNTNAHALSIEETRETLRMLLQAAAADDDDTFEVAELNNDDEDDNAFSEFVASNLKDDELEGFCTTVEDEMVMGTMRVLLDPANNAQVTAETILPGFSRTPLSVSLDAMRNAAALDRQRITEDAGRRRLHQADGSCKSVHVKNSTQGRVTCDAARGLAEGIQPAYMPDEEGSFKSAVRSLLSFGYIKQTGENSVASNGAQFAEYTDANKWGENFLVVQTFTAALQVADKVFELATEGCKIAEAFETWAGFGAGVSAAPASPVCRPIVIGAKVAALVLKIAAVDVPSAIAEAASNHDLIIEAVEVESVAENVLSVIYNQGVNYDHVTTQARNSTAVVSKVVEAAADGIEDVIKEARDAIANQIKAFETLVQQRLCDLQNAIASVHSTVNYIQQLQLVPEGSRPGFNNVRLTSSCQVSVPSTCNSATATSPRVNSATCVAATAPVGAAPGGRK